MWYQKFLAAFSRLTGVYDKGVQWVLRKLLVTGVIFLAWMAALLLGVLNTPTAFPRRQGVVVR